MHAYKTTSPRLAENEKVCVCVVDPYSTGAHVSAEAYYRGFKVIAVWSDECGELESHIPHEVAAIEGLYAAEIRYPDEAPPLEALAVDGAGDGIRVLDACRGGHYLADVAHRAQEACPLGGAHRDAHYRTAPCKALHYIAADES